MNFNDFETYEAEPSLSAQDLLSIEPQAPDEITAEEIEAERQILIARYACADHEISYDFSRLPREVCEDPENCYTEYTALSLQFTLTRYSSGVLVNKIVSDRVVAVPPHITAMAQQLKSQAGLSTQA